MLSVALLTTVGTVYSKNGGLFSDKIWTNPTDGRNECRKCLHLTQPCGETTQNV